MGGSMMKDTTSTLIVCDTVVTNLCKQVSGDSSVTEAKDT